MSKACELPGERQGTYVGTETMTVAKKLVTDTFVVGEKMEMVGWGKAVCVEVDDLYYKFKKISD